MIIGAGLAGLRTATELRERDYCEPIVLIGAETHPPYDRPPLSSKLLTKVDPVWLHEDLSVQWPEVADETHLGVHATGIALSDDGGPSTVHTSAGDFTATNVVIATGSQAINPWPGTLTLTTMDDAAHLRERLASPRRVVIIGAGWIGVELAHELGAAGHEVTLIESTAHPLSPHLGAASKRLHHWLDHVDLRTETFVNDVQVGPETSTVYTTGGDFTADVVITAIGVRPATDWLQGAVSVDAGGFIPVDGNGRVLSGERVWAVGDVAVHAHPTLGHVRGGHWFAALRDPALVAAGICQAPAPDRGVPEIFSHQGEHHVEVIGILDGDETVHRGKENDGAWVLFHMREGAVVGAIIANSPRDTSSIRRALTRALTSGEPLIIPAAELADTSTPLRRVLKR